MNKGFIGFLIGLFALAVAFCIVTFILADIHSVTFVEEIVSWFGGTVESTVETAVETTANIRI